MSYSALYAPEYILSRTAMEKKDPIFSKKSKSNTRSSLESSSSTRNLLDADSSSTKSKAPSLLSKVRTSIDEARRERDAEHASLRPKPKPNSTDESKKSSAYATSFGAVSGGYNVFDRGTGPK